MSKIDFEAIKDLYNKRAISVKNPLNAIMLQPDDSSLPTMRNEFEILLLQSYIDFNVYNKMLDIGCGAGRLPSLFHTKLENYLGVDFSENLLEIARENLQDAYNCQFICSDIKHASTLANLETLQIQYNFLCIIAFFIYCNDDEVLNTLMRTLNKLAQNSVIYIRETISLKENRIELNQIFSDKLNSVYSSIYRTNAEYLKLFEYLIDAGFTLTHQGLFPQHLQSNADTTLRYYFFKRVT